MSYNWGPLYIVPTNLIEKYQGSVMLRERLDDEMLRKELQALKLSGSVVKISNPWYYRKKGDGTWIMIGESSDKDNNFPVTWDTRNLANGKYEILGLMHAFVAKGGKQNVIARQNIVEVIVEN